jgi:hypothetical protein
MKNVVSSTFRQTHKRQFRRTKKKRKRISQTCSLLKKKRWAILKRTSRQDEKGRANLSVRFLVDIQQHQPRRMLYIVKTLFVAPSNN